MDTSEQYIKMCDCLEIQEQRKYDGGDWLCNPENGHSWAIWETVRGKSEEDIRKFMGGLLWLPRQDQIQEMMGHTYPRLAIEPFAIFRSYQDWNHYKTWEQLWLAFYMWEKHRKLWNSKKWIA